MGLDALIRSGVALAKKVTASLQVTVTHEAWTGSDGYGLATYAYPRKRLALVERKQANIRTAGGETVLSRCMVLFLEPIKANGADGRTEPIDTRDRIILPDETTGPILAVNGMIDPTTDRPYYGEVWLG